jgi:hypothetical protein
MELWLILGIVNLFFISIAFHDFSYVFILGFNIFGFLAYQIVNKKYDSLQLKLSFGTHVSGFGRCFKRI